MDCKTATLVYQAENPIAQIRSLFPEAWKFLETQAWAFVQHQADAFDTAVKGLVGATPFQFRVTHRDDTDQLTQDIAELLGDITSRLLLEQHFSQVVGQKIYFSTVCCSGHITTDHELSLAEVLPIQKAAVQLQ
ncbi:MAG: hypothetical protein MUF49_06980 [Oculatellaceae cyanobacterium Prado106]|jgi:hypothetical protein|nr:hypothetical protein [Oculatellaceae cyanobacterium Prado106]